MNKDILSKYSIPVPRYTSYPPANFFTESFSANEFHDVILRSNEEEPSHISVYIHIPFCMRLCYYCGCNAIIMQKKDVVGDYISSLKTEMKMVFGMLSHERKISQIHYGGGTPTAMPVEVIRGLNEMILSEFQCIEHPEIAIECHSGYMDEAYWRDLLDAGFNRVSLGVQDFNEEVLKASNRKPSLLPIEDILSILRSRGVAVNLDFIYGLPLQTEESFAATMHKAANLRPDRLVTFSYAHVPWVNPLMKKLEAVGLPDTQRKAALFETAKSILNSAGYESLGLDHFVLPDDELAIASRNKTLKRNFQGYCTGRTTGQVYAFGVTGISQLATAYAQNEKNVAEYIARVNRGELPVAKGYELNKEEQIAREVISELMCNYEVRWENIASGLSISVEEVKNALNYNEKRLAEFAQDGLIDFSQEKITMNPNATPFVRNVAASLDKLMLNTDKRFSKSG
ncbi:MAG: Coproporphyrinogen-III oxidase [Bacteroidetes bacterium]|jgi:oxygen-independent coproporphyrinogen III oxidase|nr:Coproporphyrinogen-III oxidase [Bacteroidota bacterium]